MSMYVVIAAEIKLRQASGASKDVSGGKKTKRGSKKTVEFQRFKMNICK